MAPGNEEEDPLRPSGTSPGGPGEAGLDGDRAFDVGVWVVVD